MSAAAISPIPPLPPVTQAQAAAGLSPVMHDPALQTAEMLHNQQIFAMMMQSTQSSLMSQATMQSSRDEDEDE